MRKFRRHCRSWYDINKVLVDDIVKNKDIIKTLVISLSLEQSWFMTYISSKVLLLVSCSAGYAILGGGRNIKS